MNIFVIFAIAILAVIIGWKIFHYETPAQRAEREAHQSKIVKEYIDILKKSR